MPITNAKTTASAQPTVPPRRRSGRRRRATAGDLAALQREVWHALRRVGEVLDRPDLEPADLCRAANSLSALANSYTRLSEAADLLPRLEALEAARGTVRA